MVKVEWWIVFSCVDGGMAFCDNVVYHMESFSGTKKIIFGVIILLAVAGASFFMGAEYASRYSSGGVGATIFKESNAVQPIDVDFTPLWKAWNVLNTRFVATSSSTPVSDVDRVWGTIQGLAESLQDPYTVFLPPADAEIFEDDISGNFEGVGMEIGMRNGLLTVIAPLKGTPAERAGVKAGDVVFRIDEEPTDRLTIDEAVKLIRGPRGTSVMLTVSREGESEFIKIDIIRDVILIPTITSNLRSDGVFVIELYNFSAVSTNLFRNALRDFIETGSSMLVLDLRGNPGGFLEAAVDMASWFLPAGEVVLKEDFGGHSEQKIHRSKGYDIFNDTLKMAILINRGSASASEILAGALSQHDKAILVGEKTFGKGSVQELVKITKETSLKVTIARWLTPNGTSISDGGLTPDIEVLVTEENTADGRDPQLEKAVEILLKEQ